MNNNRYTELTKEQIALTAHMMHAPSHKEFQAVSDRMREIDEEKWRILKNVTE